MEWIFYAFAFVMAVAITTSGVLALRWAIRRGELRGFEEQARTIFDESEPVGTVTDRFPVRRAAGDPAGGAR